MTMASVHMKDVLLTKGYKFGQSPTNIGEWNLWIGKQPKDPDRCITLYDAPGQPPNPRWLLDYPAVQVRVRGGPSDYNEAALEASKVKDYLLGKESFNALDGKGDRIVHINMNGDVSFIGWDENERPEFVFNLSLIVEPAASANTNREPL